MNLGLHLSLLLAPALIAPAGALELPSLQALRGAVSSGLGSYCEDGYTDGQTRIFKIWNNKYDADCVNAWYMEGEANKLIKNKYSDNSNWQKEAFNECAIKAVNAEVDRIEQACLGDDPSQCIELGNTAAEIVVEQYWCEPAVATPYGKDDEPDWKAQCKELSTNVCKGDITTVIAKWCYNNMPNSDQLMRLMDKCEDQVDSMVPGTATEGE